MHQRKEMPLMPCKLMAGIDHVVKDIERQYGIQLASQYVELLKRPLCSEVCHGRCRKEFTECKNPCKPIIFNLSK